MPAVEASNVCVPSLFAVVVDHNGREQGLGVTPCWRQLRSDSVACCRAVEARERERLPGIEPRKGTTPALSC